ncbi:MAG: zinc ribbon domain-containing protein [Promethearchaeota archaeon]
MQKNSLKSKLITLIIIAATSICPSILINNNSNFKLNPQIMPLSSQNTIEPTYVNIALIKNYSIAWSEAYLVFNITTDGEFNIYYNIYGIGINNLKIVTVSNQPILITPGINIIKIPIKPTFDAFPGKYQYSLVIFYNNESGGGTPIQQQLYFIPASEFKLALGISWLLILIGIFMFGLFIITFREEKLKKEGTSATGAQAYTPTFQTQVSEVSQQVEQTRPGYIKCPDCKKEIKEESSFCPECGYHIPKFLRTAQ